MGLFGFGRKAMGTPLNPSPATPSFAQPAMQVDNPGPMPSGPRPRGLFGVQRARMLQAEQASPASMSPMSSPFGLFDAGENASLDTSGLDAPGAGLPQTQSVRAIPRFSYNGPEINRMQALGAILSDLANGGTASMDRLYDREDRRQGREYDRVMGDFDALKGNEPRDRIRARMSPDMQDWFDVAPDQAMKQMYAQPDPLEIGDDLVDRRTGRILYQGQQKPVVVPRGAVAIDPRNGMPVFRNPTTGQAMRFGAAPSTPDELDWGD